MTLAPVGSDTDEVVPAAADAPVRVRLKYPDVDTFVERFAPNVTRGGIFLASRDPRPVGSTIRFQVCLMSGEAVLSGEGRVTWIKEFNPAEPQRPHGMGVQFTSIDPAARPLLDRLLKKREGAAPRRPTGAVPVTTSSPPPSDRPARPLTDSRPTEPLNVTEFDQVEESALRRMLDRARLLSSRTEDVEELLKGEAADEPASLSQALNELPRYLANRRNTGLFRAVVDGGEGKGDGGGDGGGKAE